MNLSNYKESNTFGRKYVFLKTIYKNIIYNYFNLNSSYLETKYTLENTEGVIKNGQSRDTGNIGHTRRREKTKKYEITNGIDHRRNHAIFMSYRRAHLSRYYTV